MKKFISVLLIVTVILSCVLILTACNPANKIVGTWQFSNFDFSYGNHLTDIMFDTDCKVVTFNKDGTVTNSYNETAYWKYNKKSKEYMIVDTIEDFSSENDIEYAYIDKDGVLHIDCYTYKKAK